MTEPEVDIFEMLEGSGTYEGPTKVELYVRATEHVLETRMVSSTREFMEAMDSLMARMVERPPGELGVRANGSRGEPPLPSMPMASQEPTPEEYPFEGEPDPLIPSPVPVIPSPVPDVPPSQPS